MLQCLLLLGLACASTIVIYSDAENGASGYWMAFGSCGITRVSSLVTSKCHHVDLYLYYNAVAYKLYAGLAAADRFMLSFAADTC